MFDDPNKSTLADSFRTMLGNIKTLFSPIAHDVFDPKSKRQISSYTIDCTNAGELILPVHGNFVYVDPLASNASAKLAVNSAATAEAPEFFINPGSSIKNVPYDRITVSWAQQPGTTIRLVFGIDAEIKPGNPVNGDKLKSVAGIGSIGGWQQAAVAGQNSFVLLHNSGITPFSRIVVEKLEIFTASAVAFRDIYVAQIAPGTFPFRSFMEGVRFKKGNVSRVNGEIQSSSLVYAGYAQKYQSVQAANTAPYLGDYRNSPIILDPGYALVVMNRTVNQDLTVNFFGYEEGV